MAIPQWVADKAVDWDTFFEEFGILIKEGKMKEATEILERVRMDIKVPWQYYVRSVILNSYF